MLEIRRRDGLGRVCSMNTARGEIETPALAPVVNPNRMTISPRMMKEDFNVQLVITNAYIIHGSPELRTKAMEDGVHALLDFDGPIMTDSGTFQSHVYGGVDVTNREIISFQQDIESDFPTILDIFSEPDMSKEEADRAVQETIRRAKEGKDFYPDLSLVGPIQGSTYPDLREGCAKAISSLDFAIHAVGGVVPLMENYRFADLVDVVVHSKKRLDPSKPVHLFGAGHPMMFSLAVAMGCDLFDSSSYSKFATNGRMLFPDGTRKIDELEYNACSCPVCSSTELDDLKQKPTKVAEHNLHICQAEILEIKQAISDGCLLDLVEKRSRAHPYLSDAVVRLYSHSAYLERYESISKDGGLFLNGKSSLLRPAVARFRERVLTNYSLPKCDAVISLPEVSRPFMRKHGNLISNIAKKTRAAFVVNSVLGPVPIELDEVYPVAQAVFPATLLEESKDLMEDWMQRFQLFHDAPPLYSLEDGDMADLIPSSGERPPVNWDIEKIWRVADYQFGKGAGEVLTKGEVTVRKSKKTGKIRNVFLNSSHVLSMRAGDGLFTLKLDGARLLHDALGSPRMRVIVNEEASDYVMAGRNVFAKFVVECDETLRPGDEALVVDEDDRLLAVARVLMNREEMMSFSRGIVSRVREGVSGTAPP